MKVTIPEVLKWSEHYLTLGDDQIANTDFLRGVLLPKFWEVKFSTLSSCTLIRFVLFKYNLYLLFFLCSGVSVVHFKNIRD